MAGFHSKRRWKPKTCPLGETGTSATLVVTSALLVVTIFPIRNKCLTTSNNKNLIRIVITSNRRTVPYEHENIAFRLEAIASRLETITEVKEGASCRSDRNARFVGSARWGTS